MLLERTLEILSVVENAIACLALHRRVSEAVKLVPERIAPIEGVSGSVSGLLLNEN